MKNLKLTIVLLSMISSLSTLAFDPCKKTNASQSNSWIVQLNHNDLAYKQDLVKALQLMGAGGFKAGLLLAFPESPSITMTLNYDENYWGDKRKSAYIKNETLKLLSQVPGTFIECNQVVHPSPRMGGSN